MDDRPAWARRIRTDRLARGWSQAKVVQVMRTHSPDSLVGAQSLLGSWRRWESGEVEPDDFHKRLVAKTFGSTTSTFFPRPGRIDADVLAITGMDTLEVLARLRATDVSPATIEALQITADRLGCEYSHQPPEQLHADGQSWLHQLTALLDRKLTLAQHRNVLSVAGQIALLVGCVEYDMGRRQPAEMTRRGAVAGTGVQRRERRRLIPRDAGLVRADAGPVPIGHRRSRRRA
jgi:transcriptional regulator with XRE-family HTH domain